LKQNIIQPSFVKLYFTIHFGFWKIKKLRELVAIIDHLRVKILSQSNKMLTVTYLKRPWSTNLLVEIEGSQDAVRLFLTELRVHIERFGLKVTPENWYEI
jgi:hypothetical protein